MNNLFISIILTLMPLTELRLGLPVALIHAKEIGIPHILIFLLILSLNLILIFLIFLFLDYFHAKLMKLKPYRRFFAYIHRNIQKKAKKVEKSYNNLGFIALFLLVAVPLPFTGAYSGVFISWLLNLERKKSIAAIAFGIITAGIIIYTGTLATLQIIN